MTALLHRLERSVTIDATKETVYRFFTDSARWASWWGAGSTIDARPGGVLHIRYPDGTEATGEVLELAAPNRIAFTFGFPSGKPIPVGGSTVTIKLETQGTSTRLLLTHEFADESLRNEFVQGWRYQLSLFGNVIANEVHAGAAELVDAWFEAWHEPDDRAREMALSQIVEPDLRFRDRYSVIDGLADLVAQTGAYQRFMPGIRLQRRGGIRHCQGTVLAEWAVVASDGSERGTGINVFLLNSSNRAVSVTGFWNPPSHSTQEQDQQ